MDISVWALVAPFIAAGLGASLTVWTQRHRELTAAWLSGKRDMDAARQREYSNLLRSADELAQANEFRTWRPGWNQLDENREPNADDEAAFAASSRLNQAQSQLRLIAPVDTYLAA